MRVKLHELILQYAPEYHTIERYPAADTICVRGTKDEWGIFGNFYRDVPIEYDGIAFDCTERLYQYLKFRSDAVEAKELLLAANAGRALKMRAKHIAKEHPEWLREDWGTIVVSSMRLCLELKYKTSLAFREALERSKGKYIVEDQTTFPSKSADSWGTKLVGDEYVGPNLLGRLLMELRDNPPAL